MRNKKLILASASPRRKELMTQAGFEFDIRIPEINEDLYPPHIDLTGIPTFLAHEKAKEIAQHESVADHLILAADSLVFKGAKVFTKPLNRKDAIQILTSLSGGWHTVITGICLLGSGFCDLKAVYTEVEFQPMDSEEIEFYIDQYRPFDKAGAYGIQDWIGICKVSQIRGSYTNILGLPMETVYHLLKKRMS
jgi:septum formation protein